MTVRDPSTGLPILGARDPRQEALDKFAQIAAEKQNLAVDDHDWVLIIKYNCTENDAARVVTFKQTNIPPNPPILITPETMRADSLPTCLRCEQTYDVVADQPCPGMTFEEYMMRLDDASRDEVLNRLRQQAAQLGPNGEPGPLDVNAIIREVPAPTT